MRDSGEVLELFFSDSEEGCLISVQIGVALSVCVLGGTLMQPTSAWLRRRASVLMRRMAVI